MKKRFALLLALCLALFLCACSSITNTVHFVQKNGVDYEVDTKAQTISDNDHTYQYHYSPGNSSYTITITYPNGSTYAVATTGRISNSGHSADYNPELYTDGETLIRIVADVVHGNREPNPQFSSGKVILVVILLALGIFYLASPHTAWYLSRGWYYKDAEPSDAALTWARISGVIFILLAVIAIFMPI